IIVKLYRSCVGAVGDFANASAHSPLSVPPDFTAERPKTLYSVLLNELKHAAFSDPRTCIHCHSVAVRPERRPNVSEKHLPQFAILAALLYKFHRWYDYALMVDLGCVGWHAPRRFATHICVMSDVRTVGNDLSFVIDRQDHAEFRQMR